MASFYTGNTGNSTGPHLDFRVWDVEQGGYTDPRPHAGILRTVDGKLVNDVYSVTSSYGMRTHPTKGGQRMHHGIDYGTPGGTQINVEGGKFLTTFDDAGGGITNQYSFTGADGREYEALLMHGNNQNNVLTGAAVTGGLPHSGGGSPPVAPQQEPDGTDTDGSTALTRAGAKERAAAYSDMSKAQLDAKYDELRSSNPASAAEEGMRMHKAFFNKP